MSDNRATPATYDAPNVTGGHSTMCRYLARQKRDEAQEARSTAAAYGLGEDGRGTNLQRAHHLDAEANGLEEIADYIDAHINGVATPTLRAPEVTDGLVASSKCPICGVDTPHAHPDEWHGVDPMVAIDEAIELLVGAVLDESAHDSTAYHIDRMDAQEELRRLVLRIVAKAGLDTRRATPTEQGDNDV